MFQGVIYICRNIFSEIEKQSKKQKKDEIKGRITELSRPGFKKPSFWGSFEKLRLGFELLMFLLG